MPLPAARSALRRSLLVLVASACAIAGVGLAPPAVAATGTVALVPTATHFSSTLSSHFTATLSAPLPTFATATGENLAHVIRDDTIGDNLSICRSTTALTCTTNIAQRPGAEQPHTYVSYVAEVTGTTSDGVTNIKAQSAPVVLDWKPFNISLVRNLTAAGMQLTAAVNQDVWGSGHWIRFYNTTTGQPVGPGCQTGASCRVTAPVSFSTEYTAYVAKNVTSYPPPAIAQSDVGPLREFGPLFKHTKGGRTGAAQNGCAQACIADPVNSATGVYWEQQADLYVAGRGPALAWGRTYSAARAAEDGPLGHGWALNYGMRTKPGQAAGSVDVVQENGSEAGFIPDGTGYKAEQGVLADLVPVTGGGHRFTRRADRMSFLFAADGRLQSITDPNDETTALAYGAGGQLASVTDPAGRAVTVAWAGGRISGLTDSAGRTVAYSYSAAGDLASVTAVDGAVTGHGYDAQHRMTSRTNPRGHTLANVYDTSGRITQQTDENGKISTFAYSTANSIDTTTFTDARGTVTKFDYWARALVQRTDAAGTPQQAVTRYALDPATLAPVAVTDPNGKTTTRSYSVQGDLATVTDPLGATTFYERTPTGEVAKKTNALGVATTWTYDARGNPLSASTPLDATTTQTMSWTRADPAHPGDVTAATDPRGKTTSYGRNAAGDVTSTTDPLGRTTTTTYDGIGRPISTVSPRGNATGGTPAAHRTVLTRDPAGRVLTATDPKGGISTLAYDANGNATSSTDANGKTSTTAYDPLNRPTAVTRPDGTVLATAYDNAGNTTSQTDAAGRATTYARDPLGRALAVTDPLGRATTAKYDLGGRRTEKTDANGKVTRYTYDDAGRLTGINYNAVTATGTTNATFGYDALGRRTVMNDVFNQTTYGYDALDRLVLAKGGGLNDRKWEHDLAGNTTKITYPNAYPSGQSVTRSYDDAGQWTGTTDWTGQAFSFAYDADGNQTGTTRPNGTTTTTTVDANGLPSSITHKAGTATLASFGYTRDMSGQITQVAPTGTGANTRTHGYTPNGRVGTTDGQTVGWDPADNLTANPTGSTTPDALAYDDANQLTSRTSATGTTAYAYSPNGNRTQETLGTAVRTLAYDSENRLTSHTAAGVATAYKYDGNGLRGSKQIGTAAVQRFAWDTAGPLPMLLMDATSMYLWGPGGTLLEQKALSGGASTYPLPDAIGTVHALTGQTGAVTGTSTYDTAGRRTATTGTATSPFGFAGEYRDAESGLAYLRARHYNPDTGQFLTRDPLVAQTRDPYGYASGNPVSLTDPSGLWTGSFCPFSGGIGFVTFVSGSACIVFDDNANIGIGLTSGAGAGTPSASLGAAAAGSTGDTVHSLGGDGTFAGAGIDFGPSLGGEYSVGDPDDCGVSVKQLQIGLGVGLPLPWAVEGHGGRSKTKIWATNPDRIAEEIQTGARKVWGWLS